MDGCVCWNLPAWMDGYRQKTRERPEKASEKIRPLVQQEC